MLVKLVKEVLVDKMIIKRPLGRPTIRWVDVVAQDITDIKENTIFFTRQREIKRFGDGSNGFQCIDKLKKMNVKYKQIYEK